MDAEPLNTGNKILNRINPASSADERCYQRKQSSVTRQMMVFSRRGMIAISKLLLDWNQRRERVLEVNVKRLVVERNESERGARKAARATEREE